MATYDPARATAWIAEESGDLDDWDPLIVTGLFYGHVETDELPDGVEWGPEELAPAGELIDWARARATRVIVRVCGGEDGTLHYSAGEEAVVWDGESLPAWPAGGLDLRRRRLPGWEHVDRTEADAPIEWDVVVRPLQAVGGPVAGFGEAVSREISRESDITVVEWASRPGGGFAFDETAGFTVFYGEGKPAADVLLRLQARTVAEAELLANRAYLSATRRVLAERSLSFDTEPLPWSARRTRTQRAHARPSGTRSSALATASSSTRSGGRTIC